MTEAQPDIVKKNFVYRRVWNDLWLRKKNAAFVVTGSTGSGKSTVALKIAQDLDPDFNIQRVVFNVEDFLRLLVEGDSKGKLKIGSAIVFDESSHDEAMDSRSSLSKTNKTMASLSTIYRAKRLIVIFVVPVMSQLDSRVRSISITGLLRMLRIDYEKERSLAEFFWVDQNSKTGEVYHKRPRLLKENGDWTTCRGLWFGRPDKELEKLYEQKKMQFIDAKINKWYKETTEQLQVNAKQKKLSISQLAEKVRRNKDKFMANNRLSEALVVKEFGCGLSKATQVVKIARMEQ